MTQLAGVAAPASGFDPSDLEVQRDPYPYYHWLLRNDPVHYGAMGIWFVSRYADVRSVMSDPRFARAGIRDFWAELVGPGPLSEIMRRTLFFQDDPDHARLRTLIGPIFAPRVLRSLQASIDETVDELLAPLLRTRAMDVINDIAYPLALSTMSRLLGLPENDLVQFRTWSLGIGPTLDLAASPEEIARGQQAMGEFTDYIRELIPKRRREPGEDLLSVMLRAHDGADPVVSENEILSTIITLVFAGHETVTNQIGNGILTLIHHADQRKLLQAEPDRIADAVEEIVRYDSSVQSNSRQLVEDVDFHGQTMRRGELVVALVGAANRDPAEFVDPDRFDVTRTNVHPMTFGAGMRFCLGAILARMELRSAFGRFVRLNDVRLAVPEDELVYQRSTMFRGLVSLPITFTAA
jgi:cytochrome P450